MYTKKVMDHFMHPRNMGEMEDADAVGKVGNPICGDMMYLYIKVRESSGKFFIEDIKFKTFGCASAIATSSVITGLVKGRGFDRGLKLTKDDIIRELGELPPQKIHCSVLAIDALHEAIYEYLREKNLEIPEGLKKRHRAIRKETEGIEKSHKH
jgi:nitrogen fixation NifU-like protein